MKKIAIIERLEKNGKDEPFNIVYYLDSSYRKIFDKLNIITGTAWKITPLWFQKKYRRNK